jgi:DNA-binding CsgD family transcriptional regulator/tetratricopeptide (TPR) repeat protein
VTSLALADELRGNLRSALQLADRAVSQADKSPARVGHRYPVHAVRGLILIDLDRLEDASSTLATGMRIGEELGARLHLPSYQVFGAYARFTAGDWDGALAEAQASLELAEEIGETYTRVFCHSLQSLICLHRNDLPAARAAATMAAGELSATGQRYRSHWSAWATALIAEADGNTGQAFAALAGCWDQCALLGLAAEYRVLGPDLARLALANGEPGRARDAAAAVAGIAERNDTASLTGAALHCQGLAEDDAGVLATAAHAYEQGRRPLELARACEDAGAAFARRDEPGQARPLIEQALDIYEHLDAARDLARADAALRRLGVRRGSRTTRKRPQFGWESLTPTELTVAGLVADGLSNPQIGARLFVSRRTVQAHLAHVFAKLGISSRAQLAAEVTRRREGAPETADG